LSDLKHELAELGGDVTTAVEELPVPAILLDRDGVIRWHNAAARAVRGDAVGRTFTEFVAADDLEQANDVFRHILCRGMPAEFTLHVHDADGQIVPVEISCAPVRDEESVVGIFGLAHRIENPSDSSVATTGSEQMLTPRQLEVLRLLAQGASTYEIASMLHLSPTTVRNHVANILGTLDVHTRLQAVIAARRMGLID
jgi:PAS domain S-box-containing protein